MNLSLASHRAILKALQAFEDGELALVQTGPLTVVTSEGDLRFIDGTCFESPRPELVGGCLVGWLEELGDLSGVGAWWRPGLCAVLRSPEGRALVSAGASDLSLGGLLAASGFATHTARFLVAHGEKQPAPSPREARLSRAREVAETLPAADLASGVRPVVRPQDAAATLRARGEWRTIALVPWTLGEGRPPPRLTQPAIPRSIPRSPDTRSQPKNELFFRRIA